MSKFTSKFAQLLGVARVRQSETGAREALNEELVRQLTEGEPVEIRRLCDDGVWRDVRVAPFEISGDEPRFRPLRFSGPNDAGSEDQ